LITPIKTGLKTKNNATLKLMSKILGIFFTFLALYLIFTPYFNKVQADYTVALDPRTCRGANSVTYPTQIRTNQSFQVTVKFNRDDPRYQQLEPGWLYGVKAVIPGTAGFVGNQIQTSQKSSVSASNSVTYSLAGFGNRGLADLELFHNEEQDDAKICNIGQIQIFSEQFTNVSCQIRDFPKVVKNGESFNIYTNVTPVQGFTYRFYILNTQQSTRLPKANSGEIIDTSRLNLNTFELRELGPDVTIPYLNNGTSVPNPMGGAMRINTPRLNNENHTAVIAAGPVGNETFICARVPFNVTNNPPDSVELITSTPETPPGKVLNPDKPGPGISGTGGGGGVKIPGITCKYIDDPNFNKNEDTPCSSAAGIPCKDGIETAIGCIPTNPVELIKGIVRFSIGIGGGIALLMMIIGSFQMMTSAGNPERLNGGKDRFTNAIIGLLVIIFSVFLLRVIGVDILGLDQYFGL
jgi:hypothetical protein